MFSADFISGSRNFRQHVTSGVLILIHPADAYTLVMACVACVCVCSIVIYIITQVILAF